MTTQTENDLAELSRMKGEDLAKCREELQAERETKMRHWDRVNEEQLKIAAAEIEQLQQACHRAAEICAACTGGGMYADELQSVLTMANQVEGDLTGLAEELTKCRQALVDAYNDRDEAHEVIRDLLGNEAAGMALAQAKIRATKLLARYTTEDE